MGSFYSLPKKPWWDGCARCNGDDSAYVLRVFKCVSPAFAELDAWACFFSTCVCVFSVLSHITLFYTLVNQVGGKELLEKASHVIM